MDVCAYVYLCMYGCMGCLCVCLCVYAYLYVCLCICIYICLCICMYVWISVCMCVCLCPRGMISIIDRCLSSHDFFFVANSREKRRRPSNMTTKINNERIQSKDVRSHRFLPTIYIERYIYLYIYV